MERETKTIGERSEELANTYFDMFKHLRESDDKYIKSKAEDLALHDLVVDKLICEFAIENLKGRIKDFLSSKKELE